VKLVNREGFRSEEGRFGIVVMFGDNLVFNTFDHWDEVETVTVEVCRRVENQDAHSWSRGWLSNSVAPGISHPIPILFDRVAGATSALQ
jgi:hypothetical protein